MGKRVIKINLVGAICVVILTIAIIIGLIVGIPKFINKPKSNDNTPKTETIDENQEFLEKVTNEEGKEIESKIKIYKSDLGYTMKYDYELFAVEKNAYTMDRYVSIYSNTIGITVEKQNGRFSRLPEFLNNSIQNNSEIENQYYSSVNTNIDEEQTRLSELFKRMSEGIRFDNLREFNTIQTELAGKQTFKRTIKNDERTDYIYCIKIDEENFYIIHAYCGVGFTNDVLPVVENMINSFTILEEK